jgi:hypothetical protein
MQLTGPIGMEQHIEARLGIDEDESRLKLDFDLPLFAVKRRVRPWRLAMTRRTSC